MNLKFLQKKLIFSIYISDKKMKKLNLFFFLIMAFSLAYGQKDQYNFYFKTWNFLKYYHPDLASGKTDPDSLFLATIEKMNDQSDADFVIRVLTEKLNNQFPGAPVKDEAKDVLSVNQNFNWYQRNKSISAEHKTLLDNIYGHRFIASSTKKDQQEADKSKNQFPKDQNLPLPYRLLIMAKFQGSIDYLYPHKYLMGKDSDSYFLELLNKAIKCTSRKDFEIILAKAAAKMEDTHAFKFYDQLQYKNEIYHRLYYPPFDYVVFDDHLLVTRIVLPEKISKSHIRIGDKITEINGKSIRQIVKEKQELISASNKETLLYMISDYQKNLIWPDNLAQKELKIQSEDHKNHTEKVDFTDFKNKEDLAKVTEYIKEKFRKNDNYKMDHKDIAYFKIHDVIRLADNISDDQQDAHMEQIFKEATSKKAIVFDMRGYPDWGGFVFHYVYKYFSPVENHFGLYYEPNIKNRGTYTPISYAIFGHYYPNIENKKVHPYNGKVFIIVNPETLSMSEWNTMNLQNVFPQAITMGQKTAGADGDIVTEPLAAGYNLVFTGNGIFYYDKTQTQKVGVKINEVIRYKDEDIIQKRDLELERILKALK
ncbi:hypothetical protein ACM46_06195 [Chryseobacterium angstadtii]|uniref:Tail specific protease domain-containing protein n=2 Tax=Chryseobacterium angstadtii TaxID=558151 RepID=A0A0J7IGC8_9FLAO|nr:hypothetical protein ACM46_06195 [Chryseobacterium angstadtii]